MGNRIPTYRIWNLHGNRTGHGLEELMRGLAWPFGKAVVFAHVYTWCCAQCAAGPRVSHTQNKPTKSLNHVHICTFETGESPAHTRTYRAGGRARPTAASCQSSSLQPAARITDMVVCQCQTLNAYAVGTARAHSSLYWLDPGPPIAGVTLFI